MIAAAPLVWILRFLRSPLGRTVVEDVAHEIGDALQPGDPPQPLSSADIRHQRGQIDSAAHAFPPTLPPSAPPSAPPEPPNPNQWIQEGIRDSRRCVCGAAVFVCRGVVPCCALCHCRAAIRDERETWARWPRKASTLPPPLPASAPPAAPIEPERPEVERLGAASRRCACGAYVQACRGMVPCCCPSCECAAILSEDRAWAVLRRPPP